MTDQNHADERELMRRYGLSAEDVKQVRGESWAERCEDAERLKMLREGQERHPNKAELLALSGSKGEQHRALVELLHGRPGDEGGD